MVALLTSGGGCAGDGLADHTFRGEPIGTFRGALDVAPGYAASGEVSIAFVWMPKEYADPVAITGWEWTEAGEPPPPAACDGPAPPLRRFVAEPHQALYGAHPKVATSVAYDAHFPVEFTIPVYDLPPDSARVDASANCAAGDPSCVAGHGYWATAGIVAYSDDNGNGVFDLGNPGRRPDEILAIADQEIYFLDGSLSAGSGEERTNGTFAVGGWAPVSDIPQGFSIAIADDQAEMGVRVEPPETPIRLAVSGTYNFQWPSPTT